jgi:uncharacterized heparinase superfamily protein
MAPAANRRTGRSRFYHEIQLRGPVPSRVLYRPALPHTPPESLVEAMLTLSERPYEFAQSPDTRGAFERFAWVPLLARGGEKGAQAARNLLRVWLDDSGEYSRAAWSPALTAERLSLTLRALDILLRGADAPFRERVLDRIARQGRHLVRAERRLRGGEHDLLPLAVSRALVAAALPPDETLGEPASAGLTRVLGRVAEGTLPKGWRAPNVAVKAAADLIALEAGFRARRLTPPIELVEASKVARLLVGGLMIGDDQTVTLPGTCAVDAGLLRHLNAAPRAAAAAVLVPLGLHRIASGGLTVWADAHGLDAHIGATAIAVAVDGEPVIVNCGIPSPTACAVMPRLHQWAQVLSNSAAASTLEQPIPAGAAATLEHDGTDMLLVLERRAQSRAHKRRLWLAGHGLELKGEDAVSQIDAPLYRFHLAPDVTAAPGDNAWEVKLATAGGRSLTFVTSHASLTVEESVFASAPAIAQSQQIVLRPDQPGMRWALRLDGETSR